MNENKVSACNEKCAVFYHRPPHSRQQHNSNTAKPRPLLTVTSGNHAHSNTQPHLLQKPLTNTTERICQYLQLIRPQPLYIN